jgi:quinol monooxygenase YgiN
VPKLAVLAKFTALPGKREEIVAVMSEMVKVVQDEPGTLVYAMNTDKTDPDVIWFYEVYADQDALVAHGGSEAMKAAGGKLRDKAAGRPELTMLDLVDGKNVPI